MNVLPWKWSAMVHLEWAPAHSRRRPNDWIIEQEMQWLVRGWAANGMERVPIAVLNQHTGSTRPGMVPAIWKLLAGGFGRIIVARERADGSYEVAVYELDRPAGA